MNYQDTSGKLGCLPVLALGVAGLASLSAAGALALTKAKDIMHARQVRVLTSLF